MDYFEIARIIFFISLSIGILIVSIQLGRLIGQLSSTVKDARKTFEEVDSFISSVQSDYSTIRDKIFSILKLLEKLTESLTSLAGFGKLLNFLLKDKHSSNKSADVDNE